LRRLLDRAAGEPSWPTRNPAFINMVTTG